jgi:AcrR family transcriptional regulator
MPIKATEREAARRLRVKGLSLKRIAAEVGVSVGSVHAWTRDIELTEEQKASNQRGPGGPQNPEQVRKRAAAWAARCRQARLAWQEEGRKAARAHDPLHVAGCMLYWAEGAKSKNQVKLVNSDPHLIATFRRFLTVALGVEPRAIRFSINVYTGNGLSIEEIEEHWLTVLRLPRSCARKHMLNHHPTSSSGRAKNKLPYGVCSVVVHSTPVVQHIYGAIQEYVGFEEPAWLG